MYTKFSATIVFDEDKTLIQDLRLQYKLTEKLMMRALINAALSNKEVLDIAAQEVLLLAPKRGRKKKETVEQLEELVEGAGV